MFPPLPSPFRECRRPNPRGIRVTVAAIVLAVLVLPATPSTANRVSDLRWNGFMIGGSILPRQTWSSGWYGDTYALDNTGATLGAGEPTEGGVLTRSIW